MGCFSQVEPFWEFQAVATVRKLGSNPLFSTVTFGWKKPSYPVMVGFLGWIERPEVFWFGSLFLLNRISLKDSLWRRRDTWTKNRSSLDNRTIVNDEYGSQYQIEGWYLFELHGRHQEIKHYVNEVTVWCYFRKSGRSFSKIYNWVVVSNVFLFSPPIWERFPFWRAYFSIGLVQPPTREFVHIFVIFRSEVVERIFPLFNGYQTAHHLGADGSLIPNGKNHMPNMPN